MDQKESKEYLRLRAAGWKADEAFRTARAFVAFTALEQEGYVRLRVEPDADVDLSYLEDRDVFTEEQDNEERARVSRLGVWGIIVEARNPLAGEDGPWQHIDSCWGFIGDDWKDSGYDTAFYENAIKWIAQFEGMAA